jgi:molybdopterin-guanine dinucleotide biosynthesis protein A
MNISIAILAGGMSRRFGADKTLALLNNKPLIQWVSDSAAKVSADVMVVSKEPAKYDFLTKVRHVQDPYEQQCPMVGIIAALQNAQHDYTFVISADTPLFPFESLESIVPTAQADAIVPNIYGKLYPCAAIYHKAMLPLLNQQYERQDFRLTDLLKLANTQYIDESVFIKYTEPAIAFSNVNTQEDLVRIQSIQL